MKLSSVLMFVIVMVMSADMLPGVVAQEYSLACVPEEDFQIQWGINADWQQIVPDEGSIRFVTGTLHTHSRVLVGKHWEASVEDGAENLPYNICQFDLTIEPPESSTAFAVYQIFIRWRCRVVYNDGDVSPPSKWSEKQMVWMIIIGPVSIAVHY